MCAHVHICDYGPTFLYICVHMYIFVTVVLHFCTCVHMYISVTMVLHFCTCVHMYISVTMVPCFFSDPLQHKGSTRSGGCPQLTGLSPGVFLLSSLVCT